MFVCCCCCCLVEIANHFYVLHKITKFVYYAMLYVVDGMHVVMQDHTQNCKLIGVKKYVKHFFQGKTVHYAKPKRTHYLTLKYY